MRQATALPVVASVTSPRTVAPSAWAAAGKTRDATSASTADRRERDRMGLPRVDWGTGLSGPGRQAIDAAGLHQFRDRPATIDDDRLWSALRVDPLGVEADAEVVVDGRRDVRGGHPSITDVVPLRV